MSNILKREDLEADLVADNPVLKNGKICYVVDKGYLKLGDGTTAFNSLPITNSDTRVAMAANDINLAAGSFFTKTISGATTFSLSNVPVTGQAVSFILELTNGGSATVTWFSGVKWAGGTAPTLTASGVDILGFYSHDGGTTWRGLVLAKDSK
jgi:hypothetical protein